MPEKIAAPVCENEPCAWTIQSWRAQVSATCASATAMSSVAFCSAGDWRIASWSSSGSVIGLGSPAHATSSFGSAGAGGGAVLDVAPGGPPDGGVVPGGPPSSASDSTSARASEDTAKIEQTKTPPRIEHEHHCTRVLRSHRATHCDQRLAATETPATGATLSRPSALSPI